MAQDQRIRRGAEGRVVLPHSLREAARLSLGSVRIEDLSARISRMQGRFAKYVTHGQLVSDELISERYREGDRATAAF